MRENTRTRAHTHNTRLHKTRVGGAKAPQTETRRQTGRFASPLGTNLHTFALQNWSKLPYQGKLIKMGVRVSLPGLHLLGTGGGWFVGVAGSSVMARGLHIPCAKSGVALLGQTASMGPFAHRDCRIAGGRELQRMGYRRGVSPTLWLPLNRHSPPSRQASRQPSQAPSRPMFPPPSSPIYSLHHGKGCG